MECLTSWLDKTTLVDIQYASCYFLYKNIDTDFRENLLQDTVILCTLPKHTKLFVHLLSTITIL